MGSIFPDMPNNLKMPQEFQVGDVIKNERGTPYSGSPITSVAGIGQGRTQVHFENGEIVEFFNGVQHQMEE